MKASFNKGFALAVLALVSVHQSEANLLDSFQKVGNQSITPAGLFRTWVVHHVARNFAKDNLPDSELFNVGSAKLHAHEVWETLASAVVEYINAQLFHTATAPKDAAKLVASIRTFAPTSCADPIINLLSA